MLSRAFATEKWQASRLPHVPYRLACRPWAARQTLDVPRAACEGLGSHGEWSRSLTPVRGQQQVWDPRQDRKQLQARNHCVTGGMSGTSFGRRAGIWLGKGEQDQNLLKAWDHVQAWCKEPSRSSLQAWPSRKRCSRHATFSDT
jgi:hypothetical protein